VLSLLNTVNGIEWAMVDVDLGLILEEIQGTGEKKLERMSDPIYFYRAERFVTKEQRKETPTPPKSRRQQEIEHLIKERRDLRKLWKKSSLEDCREQKTQHSKKEKTRSSFYIIPSNNIPSNL